MMDAGALERLRHDYWHLIGHRSQVARPGDYIRFRWYDEELVVFNDNGSLLAFDNICPHRGARIFSGDWGNQRLRCPYHGWSYSAGRFHVPFPMQIPPAELERARFRTFAMAWLADFLFIGVAPRCSLEEQLAGLADLLRRISDSIGRPYDAETFEWRSDWQIALENALEQYHTAVGLVHPESFGLHKTTPGHDEYFSRNSVYRCEYTDPKTNHRLQRLAQFFDLSYQHPGYLSIYVFPFAMIGSTYGYSYSIQHFFPSRRPDASHFSTRMLASRLKPEAKEVILAPFFASSMAMNRKIFAEDHAICERVSPWSLESAFVPILAESEQKIGRLRANLAAV